MDLIELKASENGSVRHPWEWARLAFVIQRLERIRRQREEKEGSVRMNILDVGCGDAFVASELAARFRDIDVVGYDPFFDEEVLEFLQKRYDHLPNLKLDVIMEAVDSTSTVSIVTLLDVIEHIPDEIAVLKELRQHPKITTNTDFLITVPAYQKLFSKHDVFMKHFQRYDREMLHRHLEEAGFEVIESRYFFFSLLLPRWLQVSLERNNGSVKEESEAGGVSQWKHGKFISQMVLFGLKTDWKLTEFIHRLGLRLPGLSLYCLCRPAA